MAFKITVFLRKKKKVCIVMVAFLLVEINLVDLLIFYFIAVVKQSSRRVNLTKKISLNEGKKLLVKFRTGVLKRLNQKICCI